MLVRNQRCLDTQPQHTPTHHSQAASAIYKVSEQGRFLWYRLGSSSAVFGKGLYRALIARFSADLLPAKAVLLNPRPAQLLTICAVSETKGRGAAVREMQDILYRPPHHNTFLSLSLSLSLSLALSLSLSRSLSLSQ